MPRAPITRTCGKWTWVSTRPGRSTPLRRSTTSSSGWARPDRLEGAALDDRPAHDQQAGVVVAAQRASGERVVRRVEDPSPEDRHGRCPAWSAWNVRTSSAATAERDRGGVLALEVGVPDRRVDPGDRRLVVSLDGQALLEPAPLRGRPDQPDACRGGRSAARRRRARSPRRGRASSPARACRAAPARGRPPAAASGGRGRPPGRPRRQASRSSVSWSARESTRWSSRSWRLRIRASSRPTCPTPKTATDGTTASGSSSSETSPPQHCRPCSVRALSLSDMVIDSGGPAGPASSVAGAGDGGLLEVAAADAPPDAVGGDDHLGAGVAWGVTAHVGDGDQDARDPFAPEALDRGQPVHHGTSARATCSDRGCRRFGVRVRLVGYGARAGPPRRGRARRRAGPARSPSRPPRAWPATAGRRWCRAGRTRPRPDGAPRARRRPASAAAHRRPWSRRRRRPRAPAGAGRR